MISDNLRHPSLGGLPCSIHNIKNRLFGDADLKFASLIVNNKQELVKINLSLLMKKSKNDKLISIFAQLNSSNELSLLDLIHLDIWTYILKSNYTWDFQKLIIKMMVLCEIEYELLKKSSI